MDDCFINMQNIYLLVEADCFINIESYVMFFIKVPFNLAKHEHVSVKATMIVFTSILQAKTVSKST